MYIHKAQMQFSSEPHLHMYMYNSEYVGFENGKKTNTGIRQYTCNCQNCKNNLKNKAKLFSEKPSCSTVPYLLKLELKITCTCIKFTLIQEHQSSFLFQIFLASEFLYNVHHVVNFIHSKYLVPLMCHFFILSFTIIQPA